MFNKFFPDEYMASTYVISFEKLFEKALRFNLPPPIYTASAPKSIAIFSFSKLPAGANISGFLI